MAISTYGLKIISDKYRKLYPGINRSKRTLSIPLVIIISICIIPYHVICEGTQVKFQRGLKIDTVDNEQRIALIIGNSSYKHTSPLKNPRNDAEDVAKTLTNLGFQVISKTDTDLESLSDAIFQFGERLRNGGVGLFYYSGHAVQVRGENYLIPIDADIKREDQVRIKTVSLNHILEKMDDAKTRLNMVFLDACRDNPFPRGFRSVTRGLANVDVPSGSLLVFATGPGSVASDGTGRNGTYTKHLLRYIQEPALEVGMMLRKIRTAVREETGSQQIPWENGSIEGEFYFTAAATTKVQPISVSDQKKVQQISVFDQKAPAPNDIKINPPGKDVSSKIAAFSGWWNGFWGGRLPSQFIVENITEDTATVVYTWGDHSSGLFKKGWVRKEVEVHSSGKIEWGNNPRLSFQIDQDKDLIYGTHGNDKGKSFVTMTRRVQW